MWVYDRCLLVANRFGNWVVAVNGRALGGTGHEYLVLGCELCIQEAEVDWSSLRVLGGRRLEEALSDAEEGYRQAEEEVGPLRETRRFYWKSDQTSEESALVKRHRHLYELKMALEGLQLLLLEAQQKGASTRSGGRWETLNRAIFMARRGDPQVEIACPVCSRRGTTSQSWDTVHTGYYAGDGVMCLVLPEGFLPLVKTR
jgi:hypothetical protein